MDGGISHLAILPLAMSFAYVIHILQKLSVPTEVQLCEGFSWVAALALGSNLT